MASFAGVSLETRDGRGVIAAVGLARGCWGRGGTRWSIVDGRWSIVDCRLSIVHRRRWLWLWGYCCDRSIDAAADNDGDGPARSRLDPGSFPVPRRPRPLRPSCPAIGCMYERRASQGPAPGGLNSGGDDSSPERDSYEQTFLVTFRSLVGSRCISFIHTHCEPRDRQRSPFRLRPSFEFSLVAHARGTRHLA